MVAASLFNQRSRTLGIADPQAVEPRILVVASVQAGNGESSHGDKHREQPVK